MFTHILHSENPFNQIIYTSTLSFMAFRPLAVQCQCVQRTFVIPRYVLQKMATEVMEECKFLPDMLWNIKVFSQKYFFFLSWCDVYCPADKNSSTAAGNTSTIASWWNNRSRIPFSNLLNFQTSQWKNTGPESIICVLLQANLILIYQPFW